MSLATTDCNTRPGQTGVQDGAAASKPVSVCLLISSLEFGGAERQVVEMMRTFDRSRVHPIVCSLSTKVPLAAALPDRDQCLHIVEKRGRFDFTTVFRLAGLLRRQKVDVLHTFLFDSEIIGRLAALLAGVKVVISSERNTDYSRPFKHRVALKLTRPLFDTMVANSNAGKQFNVRTQGLDPSRIEVVHNGVDTEKFQPDVAAGQAFRASLGIPLEVPVVGMVGSFKRQKGHDNFLRMAALLLKSHPTVRFLIVGAPVSTEGEAGRRYEEEIHTMAESLGVKDHCHFIGNQKDMKAVYNACSVTALLSRREGTPNVVLESMACGVPAVASDVADNALIITSGTSGFIVPVDDPIAAAECLVPLLSDGERLVTMSTAARSLMCEEYSLQRAAQKLERIYQGRLLARN
jgi:glycosyltransferase involved in cell wall biosynthesis